jgi:hypothetical protein
MKAKITTLLLILLSSFVFSQSHSEKREKIKALKVAFITEQLDLTAAEAQKFWPIYNTFDEKQFTIRHTKMKTIINKFKDGGIETVSETEAKNLILQMENYEEELYVLKKQFIKDLMTVLPAKKIIKLKKAEDEFNRKLLRQFKDRD